jgi:hypothetical protein
VGICREVCSCPPGFSFSALNGGSCDQITTRRHLATTGGSAPSNCKL